MPRSSRRASRRCIENEVAGLEGVDKLTSQSRDEQRLDQRAVHRGPRHRSTPPTTCATASSRVMARLPDEADPPQIQKVESGSDPVLFIILSSNKRNGLELTDYAERYLVDRISARAGRGQRVHERRAAAMPCASGWIAAPWRRARSPSPTSRTRCAARTSSCPPGASNRSSASSRCAPTPRCAPRRISATWWSGAARMATWCGWARWPRCSWRPRTSAAAPPPTTARRS